MNHNAVCPQEARRNTTDNASPDWRLRAFQHGAPLQVDPMVALRCEWAIKSRVHKKIAGGSVC